MTKGIEDMLNLPSMDDIIRSSEPMDDEMHEISTTDEAEMNAVLAMAEQAEKKLAIMNGDGHEEAMDQIHDETLKHARDLMDLGFNVDQRSAATIFEKANMLYKTALDAKNSKRDAQLKAMKLALDQKKLEMDEYKMKHELGEKVVETDAVIVEDRNELIKRLRDQAKAEKGK